MAKEDQTDQSDDPCDTGHQQCEQRRVFVSLDQRFPDAGQMFDHLFRRFAGEIDRQRNRLDGVGNNDLNLSVVGRRSQSAA